MPNGLVQLERDIIGCEQCPRLREHCRLVAQVKRRAYLDEEYWGRPVPGFGDPRARLFILGLAPGAHGANRTGRVFTGDRSGDWLYRALHQTGFANQPASQHRGDGLTLRDCWVSASVRCAPPGNKPTPSEVLTCRSWLERELQLMPRVRVVVALGRLAFDNYLAFRGLPRAAFHFGHNQVHHAGITLISSYHPSQQNTSTGKLTEPMLRAVFERARDLLQP
jgi:uracil-DNA glycosylase